MTDHTPQPSSVVKPAAAALTPAWAIAGATAAILGASAVANRMATARAEAETPPVGSFVEVGGVRLHYVDRGEGPPVVLLHGNGTMLQDWMVSGVLSLAAERHRVLAFDRPGFGYSGRPRSTVWTPQAQARVIAAALEQLGVGKAVVVGHSWGAMVALALALDHPVAVSGLVLMSGYYYPTARPDVLAVTPTAIPLVGDLLARTVAPLAGRLVAPVAVKASFAPAPISPKLAELPAALTFRPTQVRASAADAALMIPSARALSRRYTELRVPIVVMAGKGDRIAHVDKHAERLAREVDGATLRLIPGQGHLFHYAAPEQVVDAIDAVSPGS